ncbi:hypothetical protein CLOP_g546 [Closterium sp. NIES-67]|nr:hypothetical protein CLOP_g546 [Closterium sp. NIES-67]
MSSVICSSAPIYFHISNILATRIFSLQAPPVIRTCISRLARLGGRELSVQTRSSLQHSRLKHVRWRHSPRERFALTAVVRSAHPRNTAATAGRAAARAARRWV